MKRNISILLIFTFFLSTTGLPISLHYCHMQETASLSSCEMCTEEENDIETSCCESESDYSLQIKSNDSGDCCVTKVIESSIKDEFLSAAGDVKIEIKKLHSLFVNVFFIPALENENFNFHFSDSSPPSANNRIFLLNSVLLI